jgi:hypothetical protein
MVRSDRAGPGPLPTVAEWVSSVLWVRDIVLRGDRYRQAQIGKSLSDLALERCGSDLPMFSCLVWPCMGVVEV